MRNYFYFVAVITEKDVRSEVKIGEYTFVSKDKMEYFYFMGEMPLKNLSEIVNDKKVKNEVLESIYITHNKIQEWL